MPGFKFTINLILKDINDPYGRDGVKEASGLIHTPTIVPKFFLKLEDRLTEETVKSLETKFTPLVKANIMSVVENLKHEGIHAVSLLARFGDSASDLLNRLKKKYGHIIVAQLDSDSLKAQDLFGVYADELGIDGRACSKIASDVKATIRALMSHKDELHETALEQLQNSNISTALKNKILAAYAEKITAQLEHALKARKIHAVDMLEKLTLSNAQKAKIVEAAQDTRKYTQRLWATKAIKNLGLDVGEDLISELTEDRYPPVRVVALEIVAKESKSFSHDGFRLIGQKLQHYVRWQEQCAALFALATAKEPNLKCEIAEWIMHHYTQSDCEYVKVAALHALDELKLNFKTFKWGKNNSLKKLKWKEIINSNRQDNKTRIEDLKILIRVRDEDMVAI